MPDADVPQSPTSCNSFCAQLALHDVATSAAAAAAAAGGMSTGNRALHAAVAASQACCDACCTADSKAAWIAGMECLLHMPWTARANSCGGMQGQHLP